jgi:hypothetical protein
MAKQMQKSGHGGRRRGSGRPPLYAHPGSLSAALEQALADRVQRSADAAGLSRSQVVIQALQQFLSAPYSTKGVHHGKTQS